MNYLLIITLTIGIAAIIYIGFLFIKEAFRPINRNNHPVRRVNNNIANTRLHRQSNEETNQIVNTGYTDQNNNINKKREKTGVVFIGNKMYDSKEEDLNEFGEIEYLVLDIYDIDEDNDDWFDIIDIEEEDNEVMEELNNKILSEEIKNSMELYEWYEYEVKPYRTHKVKYLKKRISYRAQIEDISFLN